MSSSEIDNKYMNMAIKQAQIASDLGEVPVGAILLINNEVIASDHNRLISNSDPTSHAEINVLRSAGKKINNYRLTGSILYVTLEPCAMCFGAIVHSRVKKIIYGAKDLKSGVCGSHINIADSIYFNHKPEIKGGVLAEECSQILKDFFKTKRS